MLKWLINKIKKDPSPKVLQQAAKGSNILQVGRDYIVNSPLEFQPLFEEAAKLINSGEPRATQVLLEGLWKCNNDKMTPRHKSNCKRLIGCSYDSLDKPEDAGKLFLDAKQYDPEWETARAYEALGYLCLGNSNQAHRLADEVLKDFPQNNIAWSVWIRSSDEIPLKEIENAIPSHLHSDAEISLALAITAIQQNEFKSAESYLQNSLKEAPDNPRLTEKFGCLLLQQANINDIFLQQRTPTATESSMLSKALELFTNAIDSFQGQSNNSAVAYVLIRRSSAYKALSQDKEAREDLEQAYRIDKDNPDTVYWHSVELVQNNPDEAVARLKTITSKGERLDVEYLLAQILKQRNQPDDIGDAFKYLDNRIAELKKMPYEFRYDYLSLYFELFISLGQSENIAQVFEEKVNDHIDKLSKEILWLDLLRCLGEIPAAIKKANEFYETSLDRTTDFQKRKYAQVLQNYGLHKKALEVWKLIVPSDCIGQDTISLMQCAERCEDARFVIQFSEELCKNGIWDQSIFELELHYHELFNDHKGAIELIREYLRKPTNEDYAKYLRVRLSVIGIRIDDSSLIEKDPSKLPDVNKVTASLGRAVTSVLQYGENSNYALDYAYELLRINWDDSEAHIAFMSVITPIGPKVSIEEHTTVKHDSAVSYKEDDTDVTKWHIIEDSKITPPIEARNEYPIDHPISQALLNKKSGEVFCLRSDGIQDRTATILEVTSKHVYRYNECMGNFENRFPDTNAIRKYIAIDKSGNFDITPFQKLAEQDAEFVRQLEEVYTSNIFPLYSMARKKTRSILETMNYVATNPSLKLKCCKGEDREEAEAEQIVKNTSEIVLDGTAIASLFFTKQYNILEVAPYDFIVSTGTLSTLRQLEIMQGDPDSMAGSYSVEGFRSTSPDVVKKERERIVELIAYLEKNCLIIDGLIVADIEKEDRDKMIELLGRDCLESILLATQPDRLLWTDDLATALLAQQSYGCYRIWTHFFFNYLCEKKLIDNNVFQDVTILLMQMGYYYTKPTVDTFLLAINKSNNNIDSGPAFQIFNWFSDPNIKIQGQFFIALNVIKKVWQEITTDSLRQIITIRILERLSQRPQGYEVIKAIREEIGKVFGLDVINAQKAINTIDGWMKGIQGSRIIIP